MHAIPQTSAMRLAGVALALAFTTPVVAEPFTFRGELDDGEVKAQGRYALKLTLYGYEASKVPLTGPLELLDVAVTDGRFAVGLDFGALPPHLAEGWLEVAVKSADEPGDYVALGGRSAVALKAGEVCPASWALGGNALTSAAVNFLGTTDAQPLELRVNGARVARFEPGAPGPAESGPNVVLGHASNLVDAGVFGATIAGGGGAGDFSSGTHFVTGNFGTVGGGRRNRAVREAVVAGGNLNQAGGRGSAVGGGTDNHATGLFAVAPGGAKVTAGGDYSFAAGHRGHVRARLSNGIIGTTEPDTCDDVPGAETCGDEGTFLWADSHDGDYISQGPNQFLIRALGGVGIQPGDGSAQEFANVPEASLHVFDGSAGNVSAANGSVAAFEASDDAFISVLAPAAADRGVLFGDPGNANDGGIVYLSSDDMQLRTNGGLIRMTVENDGDVGIGTGVGAASAKLHVKDQIASSATPRVNQHVAAMENPLDSGFVSVLALKVGPVTNPGPGFNFATFYTTTFSGDSPIGSIEGNGSGGVQYGTTGADYAEWLPRLDPAESIAPGDLVGLHPGGKVSKRTDGAMQVLVASTGAAIAGNSPGESPEATHTLVAFIGQVRAKVCGPVRAGDAILVRDDGSGCGVARVPSQLRDTDFARLVGTAWEDAAGEGEHRLRIAVGMGDTAATQARLAALSAENATLHARLETLESDRAQDRADLAALRALIAPALAAKER